MPYTQLVTPNLNITYTGGWCQKANENTVGQNGVYASAYKAWLANVQHKENPPKGLYVPVYLSMPNGPKDADGTQQGDVALSCPDGTVAAAALAGVHKGLYKYPSLQAYIADYAKNNGGATYLGWGEYIGKTQVVKESSMTLRDTIVADIVDNHLMFVSALKRAPYENEKTRYIGKTYGFAVDDLGKNADNIKGADGKGGIDTMAVAYYKNGSKIPSMADPMLTSAIDKLEKIRAIVG